MNNPKSRLLIVVLLLASLACQFNPLTGPISSPTEPVVNNEPTAAPPTPTEPAPAQTPQPVGVAALTAGRLVFYNLDGSQKYAFDIPNTEFVNGNLIALAGGSTDSMPPTIYYSFEDGGSLMVKAPASLYSLGKIEGLNAIVSAPGQEVFAYSLIDVASAAEKVPSSLFVGSFAAPPTQPVVTITDPESWAMRVLALDVVAGSPAGVWYTLTAWGIGGDIVYEPRRGLYYFDLAKGATTEWLTRDQYPIGISADQSWVAQVSTPTPDGKYSDVTLRNLQTGQQVTIPLAPVSADPRGAGNAVFSPNSRYVAWREASGWQMADVPDFHSRIRVADLNGSLVLDMQDSAFSSLNSDWTHVTPVAWLDDTTLLLQIGWGDMATLVRLSLADQVPSLFASGAFAGIMYP